ncbi:hypothetical protein AB3480_20450 [Rhizobium mongolense]|uniref:hypothetical protein n=1 Tax=Rhizobium mongolense TaxID=57676 RepID=UPI0034A1FB7C
MHDAENRVLRDGKHDIIFATEAEALKAANAEFLKYLYSQITGISWAVARRAWRRRRLIVCSRRAAARSR